MSEKSKLSILRLGIAIVVVMMLFPPMPGNSFWYMGEHYMVGYGFLFVPVKAHHSVDLTRLGLQIGVVILVVAGTIYTTRNDKNPPK